MLKKEPSEYDHASYFTIPSTYTSLNMLLKSIHINNFFFLIMMPKNRLGYNFKRLKLGFLCMCEIMQWLDPNGCIAHIVENARIRYFIDT